MINIFHGLTFFVASGKVLYSFCFKARDLVGVVGVMEWVGGGGGGKEHNSRNHVSSLQAGETYVEL